MIGYHSKSNEHQVREMWTFVWELQYQLELKMDCMGQDVDDGDISSEN